MYSALPFQTSTFTPRPLTTFCGMRVSNLAREIFSAPDGARDAQPLKIFAVSLLGFSPSSLSTARGRHRALPVAATAVLACFLAPGGKLSVVGDVQTLDVATLTREN